MPVILVVDDQPADQELIAQAIGREPLDWVVEFAGSAEECLVRVNDLAVDVVVTDLMMPGMDGLELVESLKQRHKSLPVILVTGQGNETLAVEALRRGASSYVPKMELSSRLRETIKQVMHVVATDRHFELLIDSVAKTEFRFELENNPQLIRPLVSLLQEVAKSIGLCGDEGRRQMGIALDEALLNAMYHGNLELPLERLHDIRDQLRDGKSVDEVETRRTQTPYCDRKVTVEAMISPQQARITVQDSGRGFDVAEVKLVLGLGDVESGKDSNRGLALIRNLMDLVEFNEAGNEITMIKHRERKPIATETLEV